MTPKKTTTPRYDIKDVFITEPFEPTQDTHIKQKVFEDYDELDNYARSIGFKTPTPDNDPNFCGWIATLGDSTHDPIRMLKEAMQKLKNAQQNHKAILGFCQTGNFSVGYTIYTKDVEQ